MTQDWATMPKVAINPTRNFQSSRLGNHAKRRDCNQTTIIEKKKTHGNSDVIHNVLSTDHHRQLCGTLQFRKVLLKGLGKDFTIQCVINAGVVPRFVEFLHLGDTKL